MRALLALVLLAGCGAAPLPSPPTRPRAPAHTEAEAPAPAPEPLREEEAPPAPRIPGAAGLERAFLARMTVHTRADGSRVLTRRCREGPVPCEARVAVFARLLAAAARRYGLDPFLLGALAWRESGLDPSAVSRRGAAGILQLHPRGVGRGMRFVTDRDYRRACQREVEACQGPVVTRGAEALAGAIERCGSVRAALGAYATGHCTLRARHIGRVLEERNTLRRLAEE